MTAIKKATRAQQMRMRARAAAPKKAAAAAPKKAMQAKIPASAKKPMGMGASKAKAPGMKQKLEGMEKHTQRDAAPGMGASKAKAVPGGRFGSGARPKPPGMNANKAKAVPHGDYASADTAQKMDAMRAKKPMGMSAIRAQPRVAAPKPAPAAAPAAPAAPPSPPSEAPAAPGMKSGGMCGYKKGGSIAARADGIAKKGRTKGRFI